MKSISHAAAYLLTVFLPMALAVASLAVSAPKGVPPDPGSVTEAVFTTENTRRPIVPWTRHESGSDEASARFEDSTAFFWAAFDRILDDSAYARLPALGIEILGFAGQAGPYRLYKVRCAGGAASVRPRLQAMPAFVNLLPILPEEKTSRKILQGRFRVQLPEGRVKATVFFHRLAPGQAERLLSGRVDSVLADPDPRKTHVVASPARVLALIRIDEVARVEDFQERMPLNGEGKR